MMSLKPRQIFARLLLVLLMMAPAFPSAAMDDALLGRWAYPGGSCEEDMTINIARDGLSGTEFFCAPRRIRREKGGWNIQFSCSGEGGTFTRRAHWRLLKNGRLRETGDGKTLEYSRCGPAEETKSTPGSFAQQCAACYTEAFKLGRSVGGFCWPDCANVEMTCDSASICRAAD